MGLPVCDKTSVVGVSVYWFGWALIAIPVGYAAYCIYLATLIGNTYWRKIASAGPLSCCVVSAFISIVAGALQLLHQFGWVSKNRRLIRFLSMAGTALALTIAAIFITFFTPAESARNIRDFREYTLSHWEDDAEARDWHPQVSGSEPWRFETSTWIWSRALDPKLPLVSFFMSWLPVFSLWILGSVFQDSTASAHQAQEGQSGKPPDEIPLNPSKAGSYEPKDHPLDQGELRQRYNDDSNDRP
jgi:hypothetical protein